MIQVVSINDPCFDYKIIESVKNTGFVIIDHSNIQFKIIYAHIENSWIYNFFYKGQDFKNQFLYEKEFQEGYFPFRCETAKGAEVADLKEFFQIYGGLHIPGVNSLLDLMWPTFIIRATLESLSEKVLSAFSKDLNLDLNSMTKGSGMTLMRIIHYPKIPEANPNAIRAEAHEDIDFITLLPAATVSGLEVKLPNGSWYKVKATTGQIIVNVGDMLQMLSNGKYKSTTHRVTNEVPERSRISMPVFVHPRKDVDLGPMTAGEYLEQRLKEIGLK